EASHRDRPSVRHSAFQLVALHPLEVQHPPRSLFVIPLPEGLLFQAQRRLLIQDIHARRGQTADQEEQPLIVHRDQRVLVLWFLPFPARRQGIAALQRMKRLRLLGRHWLFRRRKQNERQVREQAHGDGHWRLRGKDGHSPSASRTWSSISASQ